MKDMARWIVLAGIFVIPFIPLYVANPLFFPYITGKNFAFRIIVEIIFAAWIILALYEPRYRPRFSWILWMAGGLIAAMLFANILGEYPPKSFWSNFERMEGYVTLVHFFLYILIVGVVINTEKLWRAFFNTTIFVAILISFHALGQISGYIPHRYEGFRADATLGNAAYMAVYMLFHSFIALFMLAKAKTRGMRITYGIFAILFAVMLMQTATRGTTLGLIGGGFLTALYIAFFERSHPIFKKIALGGLVAIVLFVGVFIAVKDQSFVQDSPVLQRLASISLSEGGTRFTIWNMALEGVKQRPILGWGQGNFNYVFNKEYDPSLYNAEPWYDRVHNIVLDWLIAGGVVGALFYFGLLGAAIYYIVVRPFVNKDDETFTVVERGILLGLLAGYTFHNLFVFDNIVSFIFYGTILALIHSRVSTAVPKLEAVRIDSKNVEQIAVPVVGVTLIAVIYFLNVPGIQAAGDIIDAFRIRGNPPAEWSDEYALAALDTFEGAIASGSFANQEIREQMMQQIVGILRAPEISNEVKQQLFTKTEEELQEEIKEKPNDARSYVFIASFYRITGNIDAAEKSLEKARQLSPNKQQIIFEQGFAKLQREDFAAANDLFKQAYELEPAYGLARTLYVATAMYLGNNDLYDELINTERYKRLFSKNDIAVQAVYRNKNYAILQDIFERRVADNPNDVQTRVNLAVAYYEDDDIETAISILEKAIEDIPQFREQGESFIEDLKAGRAPGQPVVSVE